jgi:hypothetical protein
LSLFANIESGIRYGWLSAVWAGIPALSFFLATFIFERWLKGQGNPVAYPVRAHESAPEPLPVPVPESAPEGTPVSAPRSAPRSARKSAPGVKPKSAVKRTVKAVDPVDLYAAELAAGEVPSLRRIRADMHVGQDKAKTIQGELSALLLERVPVAA